jgi:hypothetical protein
MAPRPMPANDITSDTHRHGGLKTAATQGTEERRWSAPMAPWTRTRGNDDTNHPGSDPHDSAPQRSWPMR